MRRGVYDVCAVGHITRDRVRIGDQVREQSGGAAYYLSLVLRRLGRQVAVVTKMAPADELLLLTELKTEKIDVSCLYSATTTTFENIYPRRNSDLRVHKVSSVAAPFSPTDLDGVRARFFHLGPLTRCEMSLEFLRAASSKGDVSLDVQGLVRSLIGNEVKTQAWYDMEEGLEIVSILKANEQEARVLPREHDPERAARRLAQLVGRAPGEVIVTLGSRGAVICVADRLYRIPPVPASSIVDATGCGDTFLAAYLRCRLGSVDVEQAGRFASIGGCDAGARALRPIPCHRERCGRHADLKDSEARFAHHRLVDLTLLVAAVDQSFGAQLDSIQARAGSHVERFAAPKTPGPARRYRGPNPTDC